MSWVRLDDGFPEHPKISGLSDRAFRFHVAALCYCARNLTDGVIDRKAVRIIGAVVGAKRPLGLVQTLVNASLWGTCSDTFVINDYLDYNPSNDQVKTDRNRAAERMRALRSARSSGARSGERTGERSGTPSPPQKNSSLNGSPTTWHPAYGSTDPFRDISRQITNGAIRDTVDLEAELSAHPALVDEQRDDLRDLLHRKAAT